MTNWGTNMSPPPWIPALFASTGGLISSAAVQLMKYSRTGIVQVGDLLCRIWVKVPKVLPKQETVFATSKIDNPTNSARKKLKFHNVNQTHHGQFPI